MQMYYQREGIISLEFSENGGLYEFLFNNRAFGEKIARLYFRQLISGIEHIHGEGYAHRDLKPSNILLDSNFILKIADFGFSKQCQEIFHDFKGSEGFRSPEILKYHPYFGKPADIFAAGKILFFLQTRMVPFKIADKSRCAYWEFLCNKQYDEFWKNHTSHFLGHQFGRI